MMPDQTNTKMLILVPFLLAVGEGVCTLLLYLRPTLSPLEVLLIVYGVIKLVFDPVVHLAGVMRLRWTAARIGERLVSFTYMAAPISFLHSVVAWFSPPQTLLRRLLLTSLVPVWICLFEATAATSQRNDHVFGRRVSMRRDQAQSQQPVIEEVTVPCGPDA